MIRFRVPIFAMIVLLGPAVAQETTPSFTNRLVAAALERTFHDVTYDGSYRQLNYPDGDVPDHIGAGPKLEDALFEYPISGHYRYANP